MKIDNPFDRKVEIEGNIIPPFMDEVAAELTETMVLAWAATKAVFEDQAQPEHALKILDILLERTDIRKKEWLEERQRRLRLAKK